VTPMRIDVNGSNSSCSWDDSFNDESKRMQLATFCADSVASFLVRGNEGSDVVEEFLQYTTKMENCTEVFFTAMTRFCDKEFQSSYPNSVGNFVSCAIQEILVTCRHSGCLAEAIVGPGLNTKIKKLYGEHVTIAKAEVVFGLAAISVYLGIGNGRIELLMNKWWQDWGYGTKAPSYNMLELVKEKILREESSRICSRRSGAVWVVREEEVRCPNHMEAFVAYARMAKYLAEGVLVAFDGWTSTSLDSIPQQNALSSDQLATPGKLQRSWLKWKKSQGTSSGASSTFG
jgi:hypothetical protein